MLKCVKKNLIIILFIILRSNNNKSLDNDITELNTAHGWKC